ncbi:MAG: outer membrane beta-barrel protein [bacterium]
MGKQLGMLVLLILILMAQPVAAGNMQLGLGTAIGMDFPVVQEDQSQGMIFGFRGRVKLMKAVALEPNVHFTSFGEPKEKLIKDYIDGSKVTAYGVDATLGAPFGAEGVKPYGLFGIGFYNSSQKTVDGDEVREPSTDLGWSAGFGVEAGVAQSVSLDFRAKLVVVSSEGGASKKAASLIGGLNYYFGL